MRRHGSHMIGTAHTTSRIEALTDGVFAIVMTLLVLEIRVPANDGEGLSAGLAHLGSHFLAYFISFLQLGIYWTGHRSQYEFIRRENHRLRWITIVFLAIVALVPFSTQMLSSYLRDPLALGLYAANLIAVGIVLAWHWLYAVNAGLVDEDLHEGVVSTGLRRCLTAPALYVVGYAVSFVSPLAGVLIFFVVPLFYLFPKLIDRLWAVRPLNPA